VLRIPNVQCGQIDIQDLKSANFDAGELRKLSLRLGDVLVIRSNGSRDLVGKSAVVGENAVGMLYAGYLIRLRATRTKLLPEYLQGWLSAPTTRQTIESLARSSSGVNNINAMQLKALAVPLPELSEQARIVTRLSIFLARADRLEAEATRAHALLDRLEAAILAKAFRGELVPQDPNDEPASVLLERIRAQRTAAVMPKRKRGSRS
jgi:type I restriction enzyme S subunit